ncbi:MAG TPA: hypothetical protein VGF17_07065 [Phytomonospora sp.]
MATEVQWSELQRDPKSVAALADAGDVRVRRRDGAVLLLTREDRVMATSEGAMTAVRALSNLLAHLPAAQVVDALVDEFPWLELLPEESVLQFVTEFTKAARASVDLSQWSLLARTLHEWKATAAVYADPALLAELSGPLEGDHGAVPNPMEG